MWMIASIFILTAISIILNSFLWSPVPTLLFSIVIELRLSPKILPVVGIDTLVTLVIFLIIRAPYSLKMKHIEIRIFWKLVDELYRNFWLWMCERAIVTILTINSFLNEWSTELCLILVRVIEFLNLIVSLFAFIAFWALTLFSNILAFFWLIWS